MNFKKESGQTILEISLIIAVFVLVTIASIPSLRNSVSSVFQKTSNTISGENTENIEPSTDDLDETIIMPPANQ
jgi:Flp pilus assembly pilin Flp